MVAEKTDEISTDTVLVTRAQRGDPAALSELVSKYQDRVYNVCYRLCRNHADALDLTQSAFLRAIEALPRFEVRATFFTWLYRIAVNVTLSHHRSRSRRPTLSLRHFDDEDGRDCDPPDQHREQEPSQAAQQTELHERLEAALAQLDDEFRAAVVLRDVEGLDYAAIADVLEVPVGTVKSRIFRGRSMLREILEQQEPEVGVG